MDKYIIDNHTVFARSCRNALEELFLEVSKYESLSAETDEEADAIYNCIKEFNEKAKKVFNSYISCYESMQKEFVVDGDVINLLARYSAYTPKGGRTTKINVAIQRADCFAYNASNDYENLMIACIKHRCGVVLSEEELSLIEDYSK